LIEGEEIVKGIKQIVGNINIKGTRQVNMNNPQMDIIIDVSCNIIGGK
jgi:hypothetical protein